MSIKRDSQDPDGTGKLTYQWQTSSDGYYWTNASSQSSYKLRIDDANKYIKAIISYTDDEGFDESVQTSSTQIENHSLRILFIHTLDIPWYLAQIVLSVLLV